MCCPVRALPKTSRVCCRRRRRVRPPTRISATHRRRHRARRSFRPYVADDLVGAEIGGAVKNIIAIACGVAEGAALGRMAPARRSSRALCRVDALGSRDEAKAETLNGLCGLGDLVLTCTSHFAQHLARRSARRRARVEGCARTSPVAEGWRVRRPSWRWPSAANVAVPICAAVDAIIDGRMDVDAAIGALLSRPFRAEGE